MMPSIIKAKIIDKLFKAGYPYEEVVSIIALFDEVMMEIIEQDASTEQ